VSVVIGIDPSLTSTGLAAVGDGRVLDIGTVPTVGRKNATILDRGTRLAHIADTVDNWTGKHLPDLVVIETAAYGANFPGTFDRSGLWWMIVERIIAREIRVLGIAPATRAKYLTGSGKAGKAEVMAAVNAEYGHLLKHPVVKDDCADALVLAAIGAEREGVPLKRGRP
jgi:Holliday junction resolvasome RuvABC endonuclease subunit